MKKFLTVLFVSLFSINVFAHNGEVHSKKSADFSAPTMKHHMALPSETMSAATKAFMKANHDMHMAMNIEFTGDPDIDFVRGMIPHHQGAIDMAHVVMTYGQNGNIKVFADKVVRDQTREINSMTGHLKRLEDAWTKNPNQKRHARAIRESRRVNKQMHEDMNIEFSTSADIDFVKGMIPHHQGAVEMAKIVLEHGSDPNVGTLAWQIINAQDSEIYWMKTWLRRLNQIKY